MDSIEQLQSRLATIEAEFEPLRKARIRSGQQWEDVEQRAMAVRKQLWELTGDAYGRPKSAKQKPPPDDLLLAAYEEPGEVPVAVLQWVRKSSVITSDASDAVRWGRIVDTLQDDRYDDSELTVYRAIGTGADLVCEIRPGDWVTTDLSYAQDHLRRYLRGRGQILELQVNGLDVLQSPTGNPEEAIYAPRELSGPHTPSTSLLSDESPGVTPCRPKN